jgi:hypothetical protein
VADIGLGSNESVRVRYIDADGDGFTVEQGDCDDQDVGVMPGLPERCDGKDNDCNGSIDDQAGEVEGVCFREQSFTQWAVFDLLFVIDNSLSMYDAQLRLAQTTGRLLDELFQPYHDVHIGVVTTDMDDPLQSGKLRKIDGMRWINQELGVDAGHLWLEEALVAGSEGSFNERARSAILGALETERHLANAGFYRNEASLAVVLVSDEDDKSGRVPGLTELLDWLGDSKQGLRRAGVHAIVDEQGDCGLRGQDHLQLAAATGGLTHDICSDSYDTFVEDVGGVARNASLPIAFALEVLPLLDTIEVETRYPDGMILENDYWTWVEATREVVLDVAPPVGSTVRITYEADPLAP